MLNSRSSNLLIRIAYGVAHGGQANSKFAEAGSIPARRAEEARLFAGGSLKVGNDYRKIAAARAIRVTSSGFLS